MARSRTQGRRAAPARPAAPRAPSGGPGGAATPVPSLASATLPRVWQGIGYRPLPDASPARPLFDFAAVPWPARGPAAFTWGAFAAGDGGERLVGTVVGEAGDDALMLHGPVVRAEEAAAGGDALEMAAQLVAAALDHAAAMGARTVFARPQGLDRVWVRFGFIPVPESTLPAALAGGAATGLYAWRGGSALWTLRETAG